MVYRNNTGWLGVTLALCVFRNTLAGSKIIFSLSRNTTVALVEEVVVVVIVVVLSA